MQQSELALFARESRRVLTPLLECLGRAIERVAVADEGTALPFDPGALRAGLVATSDELTALLERVRTERSTVFVLGPAKAGKSTLLNALAGTRVAEVSVLPGYPCVLRVRDAVSEAAAVQRFDGSSEAVTDLGSLQLVMRRAHSDLVERVRAVRAAGEAFDPARHLPQAVRRVERTQSAPDLADAALELVECPSIHGPLFASHAEMLIGEPDQARAMVLVVRAGQLADDAVFDGIEELLEAFPHPLLVVNLDERSRELSRAGELTAGPEREDPARLVEAFEELSTCEPLARAVRSGQVRVLTLDLLEAARARLQGEEEGPGTGAQGTRFADLAHELSAVLDTHESFRALTSSALRRAGELLDELRELAETPGVAELPRRRDHARNERLRLEGTLAALERVGERERASWDAQQLFEALRTRLLERASARATELARELENPLARAVEDWFASGGSLQELLASGLEPRLRHACEDLARFVERGMRAELELSPVARLEAVLQDDLEVAGLDVRALLAGVARDVRVEPPALGLRALDVEAVPVRATFGQRLTLRSAAHLRRTLLGPPEAPALPLATAVKARRLGEEARRAMLSSAAQRAAAILGEQARLQSRALVDALLDAFLAALHTRVEEERVRLAAPLEELARRLKGLEALDGALSALEPGIARTQEHLLDLAERFERGATLTPAARALPAPRTEAAAASRASHAVEAR